MRRARVCMRLLAAARHAAPWQVLAGVATRQLDFLPRHADHFGRNPVAIAHRLRAEIADARLDVHPAVRLDDEQAVVSRRSGNEGARGHAVAADLRSLALAALHLPLVPLELLRAPIERFLDESARRVG